MGPSVPERQRVAVLARTTSIAGLGQAASASSTGPVRQGHRCSSAGHRDSTTQALTDEAARANGH